MSMRLLGVSIGEMTSASLLMLEICMSSLLENFTSSVVCLTRLVWLAFMTISTLSGPVVVQVFMSLRSWLCLLLSLLTLLRTVTCCLLGVMCTSYRVPSVVVAELGSVPQELLTMW